MRFSKKKNLQSLFLIYFKSFVELTRKLFYLESKNLHNRASPENEKSFFQEILLKTKHLKVFKQKYRI